MTPMEMRDEIAAEARAFIVAEVGFDGGQGMTEQAERFADALMPLIEEWVAKARETTWDECVVIFDSKFFGGPTKNMVLGWLINPYRRTTP